MCVKGFDAPAQNRCPCADVLCPPSFCGGQPPHVAPFALVRCVPLPPSVCCLHVTSPLCALYILYVRFHAATPWLLFSGSAVRAVGWGGTTALMVMCSCRRPRRQGWVSCSPCDCMSCALHRRCAIAKSSSRSLLDGTWASSGSLFAASVCDVVHLVRNQVPKSRSLRFYVPLPVSATDCGRTHPPSLQPWFLS